MNWGFNPQPPPPTIPTLAIVTDGRKDIHSATAYTAVMQRLTLSISKSHVVTNCGNYSTIGEYTGTAYASCVTVCSSYKQGQTRRGSIVSKLS